VTRIEDQVRCSARVPAPHRSYGSPAQSLAVGGVAVFERCTASDLTCWAAATRIRGFMIHTCGSWWSVVKTCRHLEERPSAGLWMSGVFKGHFASFLHAQTVRTIMVVSLKPRRFAAPRGRVSNQQTCDSRSTVADVSGGCRTYGVSGRRSPRRIESCPTQLMGCWPLG